MTSIKLKFRPSKNPAKEGTLVFQLIHRRKVCRISSNCKIFNHEWDEESGQILLSSPESLRHGQLNLIRSHVEWEMQRLRKIADELEQTGGNWRAGDISKRFASCIDASQSVFNFIHAQILRKKQLGKMRCSETYQTTLNSFMRFRKGMDLTFGMIDSELIPVKPGQNYKLTVDARGNSKPFVWIKGFRRHPKRNVLIDSYQTRLHAYPLSENEWRTFSIGFNPTAKSPHTTLMKVRVYVYWPSGVCYFDNIRLEEISEKEMESLVKKRAEG